MTLLCTLAICLLQLTLCLSDVLFASMHHRNQELATRIGCQVEEAQHFRYASVTELWGSRGGQIALTADVILHCVGDDTGSTYGNEALKYRVIVSKLQMTEEKDRDSEEEFSAAQKKRRKRGAKEFFSSSWKKVKRFFNRVFGRKSDPPETTRASQDDTVTVTDADSDPEVFAINEDLYSKPFQFLQFANGTIPEIRFSENEVEDGRVRNFKRHLVDVFSTQLDLNQTKRAVMETSVMGEHNSNYNIKVTSETANIHEAGSVSSEASKVVVVEKVVTDKDIVTLSPSEAINDRSGIGLEAWQTQLFRHGNMISSSGSFFLSLSDAAAMSRRRRETEDDVTSYIHTRSSFKLELKRRRRRSTEETVQHREEKAFKPSTRIAELDESLERRRLQELQDSSDFGLILEHLIENQKIERDEEMQALLEIVEREVSLKISGRGTSMVNAIRRTLTQEKMEILCSANFSSCKDFLQLVALAGGSEAEKIFLDFLENGKDFTQVQVVADILSDIPEPSAHLLLKLAEMLGRQPPAVMGTLSISVSHLASKRQDIKERVSDVLSTLLRGRECSTDASLIDLLEAVGNLKCERIVPHVLQVSAKCKNSSSVQIACAHALRHFSDLAIVQEWMEEVLETGDCDAVREVVGALMDKIRDQEINPGMEAWPRFGFNQIDRVLRSYIPGHRCSMEDIVLYFRMKRNSEANDVARSEAWAPQTTGSRQKRRALWDNLNCEEWAEDSKYTPIQDREEFISDRATYNKRKSCLAFRKLGVKGANAEVYAGMFAGVKEPSDPPKYKLFTKFVSGVNFLGRQMEIGSFYFYMHNGATKAYVRILGRTRQEFTNEGCTPTELRYRPLKHIPLYLLSVANVQLSLGVHLSSRLSVDTECPEADVYELQPRTSVRIGGEALGTLLFIRGAANLGADFNYKLQFVFTPTPDMCLKGSHGFEPMSINFETYFQLWNAAKQDWGKSRMWKPNFVAWNLSKTRMRQWFPDTCVANVLSNERELE